MLNRNGKDGQQRQQPYKTNQPADPAPAQPAPPQVFRSQHGAHSIGYLLANHYRDVTLTAIQQDRDVAALNARTGELERAVYKREQEIQALEAANREARAELARLAEKTQGLQRVAANNWDDSTDTKQMLEFHGFTVPEVSLGSGGGDVKVAPTDPAPTGPQDQPVTCQTCGDPMQWDPDRTQYVHPLPDGGWELAGESCKRRREQTVTMPAIDDVVVGS